MTFEVITGDCRRVLEGIQSNTFDSVVCDPPYGIAFMGNEWDHGVPGQIYWEKVFRVLKPGGYLLAFGGTRTYHRLACAIEDAGFEIRDMLAWLYASGFPKSHKVEELPGWGSAIKPALEPVCFARKPLIGTLGQNVRAFGTGMLNIDACRIAADDGNPSIDRRERAVTRRPRAEGEAAGKLEQRTTEETFSAERPGEQMGRFPANVLHDGSDDVLDQFPNSKGNRCEKPSECATDGMTNFDAMRGSRPARGYDDDGSAARFFFCAKPGNTERDDGLEGFEVKQHVAFATENGTSGKASSISEGRDTKRANIHPTVKPTALMQWLCRLVTPVGGLILDPFCGSGTTGRGAVLEGFRFIGIEMQEEYATIARARIAASVDEAARLAREAEELARQGSLF